MPRRKTSLKKKRADKKKHLGNLKIKKQLKKTLKQFQDLISGKKLDEAKALLAKLCAIWHSYFSMRVISHRASTFTASVQKGPATRIHQGVRSWT
jgi:ribosomal protein S20